MQFDLSAIPNENVEIIEASLELYGSKYSTFGGGSKVAKAITEEWDAATTTWTKPWFKKGGTTTTSNKAECFTTAFDSWDSFNVTKALFERHIKGTFYGFLIDAPQDNKAVSYQSSESSSSTLRPKLTIKYRVLEQEAPVVTVTSPNSGSNALPHDEATIEWIANDNVGVEYHKLWVKEAKANPRLIDSIAGDKRTYIWETRCLQDSIRIIVEAFDEVGNKGVDTSDYFRIIPDTVTYKPSNALMTSADWFGGADDMGSKVEFEKGDSVWCSMTLAKKSSSAYPWVNLTAKLHKNQKLSGVEFMQITYKSNKPMKVSIQDPDLASAGKTHITLLPRAAEKRSINLHVDTCFFAQPDWVSDLEPINLEKVTGIAFEPDADPLIGGSVEFEIFDVIMYGYSGTIATLNTSKSAQSLQLKAVHKGVQIQTEKAGKHSVSLYHLNGAKLMSTDFIATANANHTISLGNLSLAENLYIVQIEVGGTSIQKVVYLQ